MVLGGGILGFIPGFLPFRTGKTILFEWSVFIFITLWFIENIWIKLFLLWCVLRTIIGLNQFSQITLHTIVFALVLYQILCNKFNKDRINTVLNIICCMAVIQSVMVILQGFRVWFITYPINADFTSAKILFPKTQYSIYLLKNNHSDLVGLLDNPNIASAFLAMCLPAFFRRGKLVFIPLVIIALFFIHSFGGIIACIITSIIFLIIKFRRRSLIFISIIFLILGLYCVKNETAKNVLDLSNRRAVWNFHITKLIPKRPIIGWGLGQERFLSLIIKKEAKQGEPRWLHSHNELISLTTEMGILGLLIVCGYFVSLFKKLKRSNLIITCGLAACISASLSIFSIHSAIGLILILYMAMAERSIADGF